MSIYDPMKQYQEDRLLAEGLARANYDRGLRGEPYILPPTEMSSEFAGGIGRAYENGVRQRVMLDNFNKPQEPLSEVRLKKKEW